MNINGSFKSVYTVTDYTPVVYKMRPETLQYYEEFHDSVKEPFAVVISDDGRILSEWYTHFGKLFDNRLEGVTGSTLDGPLLGKFAPGIWGKNLYDDFFSIGANTYMKIKEDIDEAYRGDPEKKRLLMFALDKAFEMHIHTETRQFASMMEFKRLLEAETKTSGAGSGHGKSPFSPVFNHKDYNYEDFRKNLVQMGRDFVAAFTQGAKFGLDAAWENVDRLLGGVETTSVNNISYSDFRSVLGAVSDNKISSRTDTWDRAAAALAGNANLSGYMRDVFK